MLLSSAPVFFWPLSSFPSWGEEMKISDRIEVMFIKIVFREELSLIVFMQKYALIIKK